MAAAVLSQWFTGDTVVSDAVTRVAVSVTWQPAGEYEDIRYELADRRATLGIAKITINRPEVRNAFRPETVVELSDAFDARPRGSRVGVSS